jgi:hypothetical protein
VATAEQCADALTRLADRLAARDSNARQGFDRTLSCRIRDLDIVFGGRLVNGELKDIRRVQSGQAQIRLDLTSDDLVAMVDGTLNLASAWAGGRVKINAGVMDLVRLRSLL